MVQQRVGPSRRVERNFLCTFRDVTRKKASSESIPSSEGELGARRVVEGLLTEERDRVGGRNDDNETIEEVPQGGVW